MFPPHRVLAAIDFSEASRVALRMAARLAAHCDSELHVLYAEDPLLCVVRGAGEVLEEAILLNKVQSQLASRRNGR